MLRYIIIGVLGRLASGAAIWFLVPPLPLFTAIVPKDAGSALVASDRSFGSDPRQSLDVYAPTRAGAGDRLPVIVFVHGGGWRDGNREGYRWAGRAFAAQGFVAIVTGYRLSPQVHFPDFVVDVAEAVRWTRAHAADYGGDPGRIVLVGHSAGAHIAAMLALDPQWLGEDRAAIAAWVGISGPYDFLPLDTPATIGAFGRVEEPEETQPVNHVSEGDPPALLLHGSEDTVVRPRQSTNMERLLKEAGVPAEARLYEGAGHIDIMTAVSRWGRGSYPTLRDVAEFTREVAGR
ncbi:MAG: alpha/beta hydrolase [Parasphingopyxis sp.]|uniref:alpha/beta hydrolase n=1 Tax=Parasphingopyxis sp. TaxID=1920299 RepID=UPI0032EBF8FE